MPFTNKVIRILIVDDDEDDYFLTSDYLKSIPDSQFEIEWTSQYAAAVEIMQQHRFDLYFVDYRLGAKTGVDLLKQAIENKCQEPIILLTGKGNREIDRMAMKIGAYDYLVKSELNSEKLERTIRYALERYSYLQEIQRNERKFRNIFEQSMDAVFIADMDMFLKDVNQAAVDLLGYPKEALPHIPFREGLGDQQVADRILQLLQTGHTINDYEVEIITGRGERKSCIFSASVETDQNGERYIQGILHDITNLKKAEWLTLQAEKLAATGRLVRTLAHEVRNPLNNISLSAEQLQQDVTDEAGQLYLDVIKRNSSRISNIISELLNSSRPTEFELKVGSLQILMEEVLHDALDSIRLKQVSIIRDITQEPLLVLSDKDKLKIAFMNIVVNAVEAIDEGQGQILVSMYRKDKFAITEITDNGCGMSAEILSRLFEPYYTSKRNGMGLGLASTMNIIQSHKGFIEVKSVEGKGTTFVVNLPIQD